MTREESFRIGNLIRGIYQDMSYLRFALQDSSSEYAKDKAEEVDGAMATLSQWIEALENEVES